MIDFLQILCLVISFPLKSLLHPLHNCVLCAGVLGLDNLDFTATTFDNARKQHDRGTEGGGSRGLSRQRMLGSMFGGGGGGLQLPTGSGRLSSSASMDDVREMIRNLMNAGRRR